MGSRVSGIICPCRRAHARRVRPNARSTVCGTVPEPTWGWLGVDAQNQCEGASHHPKVRLALGRQRLPQAGDCETNPSSTTPERSGLATTVRTHVDIAIPPPHRDSRRSSGTCRCTPRSRKANKDLLGAVARGATGGCPVPPGVPLPPGHLSHRRDRPSLPGAKRHPRPAATPPHSPDIIRAGRSGPKPHCVPPRLLGVYHVRGVDAISSDRTVGLAGAAVAAVTGDGVGQASRLALPAVAAEAAGAGDVFIADDASVSVDWHTPPRARKPQRRVLLHGELAGGDLMKDVFALYDPPAPPGMTDSPERRAAGRAQVVEADDPTLPTEVVIIERTGNDGNTFDQLPFALTPGPPISTTALRESIESSAAAVAAELPRLPHSAVLDVLLRRTPRTHSGNPLPRSADTVADITAATLDLDSSYLAVHGPPGTGKTHTAARVINRLITEHGWRVGIVAQSHATVENLLGGVIDAGLDPQRVAKKPYDDAAKPWRRIDSDGYAAFIADTPGCVIGGTAWDFANAGRVPPGSLDLLVIDEAGQFCLANTIAVAPAAADLMLLGDPQQLPQVSQGTHPEPVDTSALDWLVDGKRTLPGERGYFLDRSYRMHPAVCAAVSALSYEGRLRSHDCTAARHLAGSQPGVYILPVAHHGNSTESPEEADAITAEITRLPVPRGPTSAAPGRWPPPTCWCSPPTTPRWRWCVTGWMPPGSSGSESGPSTSSRARRRRSCSFR